MMRLVYQCSICESIHTSVEDANACEKHHKVTMENIEIIDFQFKNDNTGFPSKISVKFNNRHVITYNRSH